MLRFVAFIVLMAFASTALPCNRCGRFGNSCSFRAVHHVPHAPYVAPAIVKSPDFIQNIQFFHVAPVGDISPRADTVFGTSRTISYNAPNSALYLDQNRRSQESISEGTAAARGLDSEFYALAGVIEEGQAAESRARGFAEAFRAFQGEPRARGIGLEQVTISLKNGKVESIQRVDPLANPTLPAQDPAPVPRSFGGLTCLKCHAPEGSAATKFVIDETFDEAKFAKAKLRIDDGSMPPKGNLTEAEKARELLRLSRLVPVQ